MDSPTEPPLPTFLIIGAQKSATRWLRSNLGKHPEIFAAPLELSFFNQKFRRGLDFYRSQFEGWAGEPVVGEATPGYMMARHKPPRVAKRIQETVPDVKLIALLRDPVDRANSALVHHVKHGRLKKRSRLVDVVTTRDPLEDRLCLVSGGWYGKSLEPYIQRFGDQVLVILYDDIQEDPKWAYEAALEHVGASTDFLPPDLDDIVFSNQQRSRRTGVSSEDRLTLWPYFEEDVKGLEQLIARDLSPWDPTPDRFRWPDPPDDLVELHRNGMAWVESLVTNVRREQFDDPTPCEWTVEELLIHMVRLALLNASPFEGENAEPPAEILELLDSDPVAAFGLASAKLDQALANTAGWRVAHMVPPAMVPRAIHVAANLVNQVAHGWDLAVATGQDASIPAELASPLDDFARRLYDGTPILRAALADEVAVSEDASAGDRFVALLGRDPSVSSPVRPS